MNYNIFKSIYINIILCSFSLILLPFTVYNYDTYIDSFHISNCTVIDIIYHNNKLNVIAYNNIYNYFTIDDLSIKEVINDYNKNKKFICIFNKKNNYNYYNYNFYISISLYFIYIIIILTSIMIISASLIMSLLIYIVLSAIEN